MASGHRQGKEAGATSLHRTQGLVLNWGWPYDLIQWSLDLVSGRKMQELRQRTLELAELKRGDAVLDVGCGTGTLALEAYERVGESGRITGIDPAPRQIGRARAKAARRGLAVDFQLGVVERLAFPGNSFEAALSTLMLHHLPTDLKRQGLSEIARVLKPEGRLVIADAVHSGSKHPGVGAGTLSDHALTVLLNEAGFAQVETSRHLSTRIPGFRSIGFTVAKKS